MNDNPESSRQDALRDARKQITSSLFLALAALGVIVFACYGWFVSNSNVSGSNISVSASGSRFELASVGEGGKYDSNLPNAADLEGNIYTIDNKDGKITNSDRTILWRVSDSSKLGNHTGGFGIEPGSSGTLQFYVVPQGVDSLNLTFTLEIIPLKRQGDDKLVQFTDPDPVAEDFLKGHLLVRYRVGEETPSLVNPDTGSFTLEVSGTSPVLVNLNWSWPYLLEDALEYPGIKECINRYPELFLCEQLYPDVKTVEAPFDLPDQDVPLFRKYSNFYNNADQYIGTHVNAILFRLTAIEG